MFCLKHCGGFFFNLSHLHSSRFLEYAYGMDPVRKRMLEDLSRLAEGSLWLVGGTVRDLLRGAGDIRDFDLVMPSGSERVARAFADRIGGSFFVLDEERRITRVIRQEGMNTLQFDFADFEGAGLAADLGRRDFTMNAMALELRSYLDRATLDGVIDLFGGRDDVRRRIIRSVATRVLDEDPLRLLRAVRFAATLGFAIDPATADQIRSRAGLMVQPAPERVREELFQVLSVPGAGRHLALLESLGLLQVLLPELGPLRDFAPGRHHQYDILTHSLKTADYADAALDQLLTLAPDHADAVRGHLDTPLEHGVTRMAALRFACLLHDSAKAETFSRGEGGEIHFYGHDQLGGDAARRISGRFRLSRTATAAVEKLVRNHMRPLQLSQGGGPSRRALYRYCRDLQDAVPESVVLALADAQATAEIMPEGFTDTGRTAATIIRYYYDRFLKTEEAPLVTGKDLIDLGLTPGPAFREILDELREKQSDGTVTSRESSLAELRAIVRASGKAT